MSERGDLGFNPENNQPINLEKRIISPESILEDNHSIKAKQRRERFQEDEDNNSQVTVFRCSDSRYLLTYRHTSAVSSIATGGPKDLFSGIIGKDGSPGVIVLPHEKCGGLGARTVLEQYGFPDDPDELESYLRHDLSDSDPVTLAINSARHISKIVPEKSVLAAVHNHENGDITPIAVYSNGTSALTPQIPLEFAEFFRAQQSYIGHLKSEYPNLAEIQSTQNPELMTIMDDQRPLETILPETTRKPGSAFRIMSSRTKSGSYAGIDPENSRVVAAQTKYPIEHFSNLSKILVATKEKTTANEIVEDILKKPWAKIWIAKPNTEIYTANVSQGELSNLEVFPL